MTKNDFDFETWFDSLAAMVLDGCGVDFRDVESVRGDYDEAARLAAGHPDPAGHLRLMEQIRDASIQHAKDAGAGHGEPPEIGTENSSYCVHTFGSAVYATRSAETWNAITSRLSGIVWDRRTGAPTAGTAHSA